MTGARLTQLVVGALLGAGFITLIYTLTGPYYGTGFTLLLLYEGYTIANRCPNDTISEIIWALSEWTLVPLTFGLLVGYAYWSKMIEKPALSFAVLYLMGHFFGAPRRFLPFALGLGSAYVLTGEAPHLALAGIFGFVMALQTWQPKPPPPPPSAPANCVPAIG